MGLPLGKVCLSDMGTISDILPQILAVSVMSIGVAVPDSCIPIGIRRLKDRLIGTRTGVRHRARKIYLLTTVSRGYIQGAFLALA